ncbi:MAG: YqeG family HAD IIIA-type phosphatase [Coriobacteriia bacterium]|nr:YqeG family HAD IIIA-type phosphatase [Coriobacteriia bacterium]
MKGPFQPDAYFARISDIHVQRDLQDRGIATVLLDIDNTLRSRADGEVPADARRWLRACKEAGVGVCLLSNNWHGNVFDLAEELDLPIVAKAMKPLPSGYIVALRNMHARARTTVVVGDQLFTDIVGAKALGIHTYMVAPLGEVDLPHMAALRHVERALVGNA